MWVPAETRPVTVPPREAGVKASALSPARLRRASTTADTLMVELAIDFDSTQERHDINTNPKVWLKNAFALQKEALVEHLLVRTICCVRSWFVEDDVSHY